MLNQQAYNYNTHYGADYGYSNLQNHPPQHQPVAYPNNYNVAIAPPLAGPAPRSGQGQGQGGHLQLHHQPRPPSSPPSHQRQPPVQPQPVVYARGHRDPNAPHPHSPTLVKNPLLVGGQYAPARIGGAVPPSQGGAFAHQYQPQHAQPPTHAGAPTPNAVNYAQMQPTQPPQQPFPPIMSKGNQQQHNIVDHVEGESTTT